MKVMMMIVMLLLVAIALIFTVQGVMMHGAVEAEEAQFHQLQTDYYTNQDKATRDAAPAGSELIRQLARISNYPSTLLKLKLLGIGKILTGIFVLLLGILIALVMMPTRFSRAMREMK